MPPSASLPLLSDALAIAMTLGQTVYDSIDIALAVATKRPFVTADGWLVQVIGARFPVPWLGAIGL